MDAAFLQRFGADLEALIGPDRQRIGIAVSGGGDSLALLLFAREALGRTIAAATVDHRLRPESADEARHVAAICGKLDIPHAILAPAEPITGNVQSGARKVRYALLEGWRARESLDWIATAHHADDQLETVLMRLLRGSGVNGLAAIRPINGRVIRPLLGFRKAELESAVAQSPFEPVDDPSNCDDRFDRVRVRRILEGFSDFSPARLTLSTGALAEAASALDWAVTQASDRVVREGTEGICLDPAGLPAEIRRRLVVDCLVAIVPGPAPAGPAVQALIGALEVGEKRTLGGVLCQGGEVWKFSIAPPRKPR